MNTVSVSPLTGKNYNIPSVLDDHIAIEQFLKKNSGKKVVVVQGLGFVGAVMTLVCANAVTEEYAVIGVDVVGVCPVDLCVGFFGGGCDQRCRQTNLVGLDSKNLVELFASRDVVQCVSIAVAGRTGISVRSAGRDIHRR